MNELHSFTRVVVFGQQALPADVIHKQIGVEFSGKPPVAVVGVQEDLTAWKLPIADAVGIIPISNRGAFIKVIIAYLKIVFPGVVEELVKFRLVYRQASVREIP